VGVGIAFAVGGKAVAEGGIEVVGEIA